MRVLIAVAAVTLLVAGCAKRPESIAPAYISHLTYTDLNCRQLAEESSRLNQAYVVAAQQQNDAASGDAVGVFLIGMPTSTLSGSNIAPQIARLKGEQEAVRQAMLRKDCGA